MGPRLVSVGECTIDHYLDSGLEFVGGISLNFAVHAARSGAGSVSLVSRIGKDHSEQIFDRLRREHVDASYMSIVPGATARQDIHLLPGGDRIFPPGGYHPGVLEGFVPDDRQQSFIQQHDVIASALFLQSAPLFTSVLQAIDFSGWRVADFLDLSDYGLSVTPMEQFSERLTIAFVSGDMNLLERLRPLSAASRCLIVITMGAAGSAALCSGEPLQQPAVPVTDVVDTTGCGDAFQAAFTVSYWNHRDVRRALRDGSARAAATLAHLGAIG